MQLYDELGASWLSHLFLVYKLASATVLRCVSLDFKTLLPLIETVI